MLGFRLTKRDVIIALAIFALVFCIYLLFAYRLGQLQSPVEAYFNELAKSLLHGQLFLENPIKTHDLTLYQGKWYVPFLPLPSILMIPWIAVFGTINTVIFSVFFGALNVSFVFLLLRALVASKWVHINLTDSLWLTILFGLGSVHFYTAWLGSVWFVSQICTVTFIAISFWLAVAARAPFLAGLALAIAMWARPHIILLYPLLLVIGYQESLEMAPISKRAFLIRWGYQSILPLGLSIIGILVYNWLRFDNFLDFGYLTQNTTDRLRQNLVNYGQFNLHFVPHNLWAMFLALPQWDIARHSLTFNGEGMSIFITSPALLFLVRARQRSVVVFGAWLSVLFVLIPLITYYNTGWYQFGYRFSLDFMVPIIILLAYATSNRFPNIMRLLIAIGVVVNTWGPTLLR